jgi:soluble lytic murein transglycosylase-like protein
MQRRPQPVSRGAPARSRRLGPSWSSLALALLVALLGARPAAPPAARVATGSAYHAASVLPRLPAGCRGSTRARVAITWPTAANLATDRRLRWGALVPARVRRWAYLIVPDAAGIGVDPYLVAAVMQVESQGDPLAWNLDSDARGLMQVLHASFEPAINVRLGVGMLGALQQQFGRRDLVLAAYNAGPGAVEQYGGIPPFTETRDYVVIADYDRDQYAGLRLSAARVARFRAARADLAAFKRRICDTP